MKPITKAQMYQTLQVVNNALAYLNKNDRLEIGGAYGGYQVYVVSKTHPYCIERTLTGYVSKREIDAFLCAYLEGLSAH